MNPDTFIRNLITKPNEYILSEGEEKTIQFEGVEKYIYNKLTSSKYRASSLPISLNDTIKQTIHQSVLHGRPIHISIPFGGYKKHQLPTYPNPDWSEVFNIIYLRDYLLPIANAYPNGVVLEYFSDEVFVSRMNNIPQKDLDSYSNQFQMIVAWINQYTNANLQIKFSRIRDQIGQVEILQRFDKEIERLKQEWDTLSKEEQSKRIHKSERNYCADLTGLPENERFNILWESTLVHDAFIFGEWRDGVPWAFDDYMIPVGFRYTGDWGIHLKSSPRSTVQFWVGIGILHRQDDLLLPTILTHKQYLDELDSLNNVATSLFPAELTNLQIIPILGD